MERGTHRLEGQSDRHSTLWREKKEINQDSDKDTEANKKALERWENNDQEVMEENESRRD